MGGREHVLNPTNRILLCVLGSVFAVTLAACSSKPSKPLPQPKPDQVRSHADQTFDHLKHEERERAVQQPNP